MPKAMRPFHRRRFLIALAVSALAIGLPLAVLAAWWGAASGIALAGADDPRAAYCPIPGGQASRLKLEEIDLRRRIAALETTVAAQASACPICDALPPVEVGLVVDTSPSMRWPATMDATAEKAKYAEIARQAGPGNTPQNDALMIAEMARTPPGQSRMDRARAAAEAAMRTMPARARVHLLAFNRFDARHNSGAQCRLRDLGRFGAAGDSALAAALGGLQPDGSGTPLAQAIAQAAASVGHRPAGTPGFVIVVTDGEDTCQGDPCATARAARQADPTLTILLVDIAANPQAACLAESTGGHVIKPDAGADIGRLIADALRPKLQQACISAPLPVQ